MYAWYDKYNILVDFVDWFEIRLQIRLKCQQSFEIMYSHWLKCQWLSFRTKHSINVHSFENRSEKASPMYERPFDFCNVGIIFYSPQNGIYFIDREIILSQTNSPNIQYKYLFYPGCLWIGWIPEKNHFINPKKVVHFIIISLYYSVTHSSAVAVPTICNATEYGCAHNNSYQRPLHAFILNVFRYEMTDVKNNVYSNLCSPDTLDKKSKV